MNDANLLRHLILALTKGHGRLEALALAEGVASALAYGLDAGETTSARQLGRAVGRHLMDHDVDERVDVLDGLLDLARRLDGARADVLDFDAWRAARAAGIAKKDADALAAAGKVQS